jgi:hypothetical protein
VWRTSTGWVRGSRGQARILDHKVNSNIQRFRAFFENRDRHETGSWRGDIGGW